MENLTSHTINDHPNIEKNYLFDNLLDKIKKRVHWMHTYSSFESYYYVVSKAIEYYSDLEDYEACTIMKNDLQMWIEKIPKNTNEAIEYLISSTPDTHKHLFEGRSTFSLAINLHRTTGMRIIDLWILRFEESPLRKYYVQEHKIDNPDQIANDILIKYIDTIKDTMEMG
jgi:hypothetical protein